MGVVRNNAIGNLSVSSAALSRQFNVVNLAAAAVFSSSALLVQGLPRIQIQTESNTVAVGSIVCELQGAITQNGAVPQWFNIGTFIMVTGAAAPSLFFEYNAAVEYIRVVCTNGAGAIVSFYVRLLASQ